MKKLYSLIAFLFILSNSCFSQTEIGVEYSHGFGKSYNSNSIGSLYEGFSNTGKSSWQFGASYNFSKGSIKSSGFGISAGYRYGYAYGNSGNLYTGLRLTFNFLKTDRGGSYTQFTPSLEAGYHYTFNNFGKGGYFTPGFGYGYNINFGSKEEKTDDGEGNVLLTRLNFGYRF